jgi:hypothetical protein
VPNSIFDVSVVLFSFICILSKSITPSGFLAIVLFACHIMLSMFLLSSILFSDMFFSIFQKLLESSIDSLFMFNSQKLILLSSDIIILIILNIIHYNYTYRLVKKKKKPLL